MTKLYGFGNALVDIEVNVSEEILNEIGIEKGRLKTTSGFERSFIQKTNGAPRNSIVVLKTIKRAHNNGICNKTGRQPPKGFTLCVL